MLGKVRQDSPSQQQEVRNMTIARRPLASGELPSLRQRAG